jgi:hypothetical protein
MRRETILYESLDQEDKKIKTKIMVEKNDYVTRLKNLKV